MVSLRRYLSGLLRNWRVKAAVLRFFSILPAPFGNRLHYLAQSRLGALRSLEPWTRLEGALRACRKLNEHEHTMEGARVLEIGTGWRINAPLAFALAGADLVVTVDLNCHLRPELILQDLQMLAAQEQRVRTCFAGLSFDEARWSSLKELADFRTPPSVSTLQKRLGLLYLAPQDAGSLGQFDDRSFDLHFSQNTFEHIPPASLEGIMKEASRLLKPTGLCIHGIDQSDHFSHFDKSISSVNFLRYDEASWRRIAGNRFSYVNRLRAIEYRQLFQESGFEIVSEKTEIDERALQLLRGQEFIPAPEFQQFSPPQAAVRASWLCGRLTGI